MSLLPWKRCIRGSGKAGCPLLIGRQGGRSLCFSPCPPCLFFSLLVLFSPLNTCSNCMCQNTGSPAVLLCHMLNQLSAQHFQIELCSQTQHIYYSQLAPHPVFETKLKLLLEQWFIAQLDMFVHTGLTHQQLHTHTCPHTSPWTVLCVILGCGRPWLQSGRIALYWIHWEHMFKTAWLGLQWLPYKQGHAVSTYQEDERVREREEAEWTAHEGSLALALETGQFILWILPDCDSLFD